MERSAPSQSVRDLQRMLRMISMEYPALPPLLPDGVFGEQTLEAVMLFQREFHPPVTGKVDFNTWSAIAELFLKVRQLWEPAYINAGYPFCSGAIKPGERCVHLYLVQSMFKGLANILEEVENGPVNGVHEGASVRNTRWMQRVSGQEETGIIDRALWNVLSRIYTVFVSYAQTPWRSRQEILRQN